MRYFKNKIKLIFSLFILGFFLTGIYSQSKSFQWRETFNEAIYFYNYGDYKEALYYFKKLYHADSTNANINYIIGMCYLNIKGKEKESISYFKKSIPHLQKAANDITLDYEENSPSNSKAPLHVHYYLAKAYLMNEQLDKALESLDTFLHSPYFENRYNEEMVQEQVDVCKRAKSLMDKPVKYSLTNIGAPVNNELANFLPIVSGDQNSMVYVTGLKFYDAIFYVQKIDGQWGVPVNITPDLQSDGNMYPTSLSYDGKELFLVKKEAGKGDIYSSLYKNGGWIKAEKIKGDINKNRSSEDHASISRDGKTLFFSSDLGWGNHLDIYEATRDESGEWKKTRNLGEVINTDGDETNPYLTSNGKILFFCSDNHYNMGGKDIFYSLKDKNGEWTNPVNLGYPINTTRNDEFFFPAGDGSFGYISRILDDGFGEEDIYMIQLNFSPFNK